MNTTTTNAASIESLKSQIQDLTNKVSEIETMEKTELQNKVQSLPQYLGVGSMEEAISIIKKNRNLRVHARGSNPGKRVWGRGRRIPDNIRRDVQDLLKSRNFTVEEISSKVGVSTATINKIKKSVGLVRQRKVQAPQMANSG